jgi:Leucine rich repeat
VFSLILVTVLQLILESKAKFIDCEETNTIEFEKTSVLVCDMTNRTEIDSYAAMITATRNKSITGLSFTNNENIFFLPENVAEKFPNLLLYTAAKCSIKEVSCQNFKGLKYLKWLILQHNQIEKIKSNTFEDLQELDWIALSKFL